MGVGRAVVPERRRRWVLEVWGRWGEKVYDSTLDNQNKGWDGIFNDKPAPADVYFYRVVVRRTSNGTEVVRNSNVTLLR